MEGNLVNCKRCDNVFLQRSPRQKYCGTRKLKEGCAYIEYREAQARSRKRLWNLEKNREWNKSYYSRNREKMRKWINDYRKRTGRHDKRLVIIETDKQDV